MRRLRLLLEYDGTGFFGFQRQPRQRTVQGVLEDALGRLCNHPVAVVGAGRTDAGVHALGQVVHWDTDSLLPADRLERALQSLLDRALHASHVEETTSGFHARYSAERRTYQYYLSRETPSPFLRGQVLHGFGLRADGVERMRQALECLQGRLDLAGLSGETGERSTLRTVFATEVREAGPFIRLEITADGFLRSMVRNLVGLLLEIGRGRTQPETLKTVLEGGVRPAGLAAAAGYGLYLVRVEYPDGYPRGLARTEERLGLANWFAAPGLIKGRDGLTVPSQAELLGGNAGG